MNRIRILFHKHLILSKRFGVLFYLSEMKKNSKRINLLRKRIRYAENRGYCAWCIHTITKAQSCYRVCNNCMEFEPRSFIHGRCFYRDDCCSGCRNIEYMRERRRIQ